MNGTSKNKNQSLANDDLVINAAVQLLIIEFLDCCRWLFFIFEYISRWLLPKVINLISRIENRKSNRRIQELKIATKYVGASNGGESQL